MKNSHTPKPPQEELLHVTMPEHFSLPVQHEIPRGDDPWVHVSHEAAVRPDGLRGAVFTLEGVADGEPTGAEKFFVVSGEFTRRRLGMRITPTGERDFMSRETFEATRKTPFGRRKNVSVPVYEYEEAVSVDVFNKEGQLTDIRTLSRAELAEQVHNHFAFTGSAPARITELGWLDNYGEKPVEGGTTISVPADQKPHTPTMKTIIETQEMHGLPSLRGLTYFSRAKGVQYEVVRDEIVSAHSAKVGKELSPWEPQRRLVVRGYDPADPERKTVTHSVVSMKNFEKQIAALDTPNNEAQTQADRTRADFHFVVKEPVVSRDVDRTALGQLEHRLYDQAAADTQFMEKDASFLSKEGRVAAWMLSELPYTVSGANTPQELETAEGTLRDIATSAEGALLTKSLMELNGKHGTAEVFDATILLHQELSSHVNKYGLQDVPGIRNARELLSFIAREHYFEQNPENGTTTGIVAEIGSIFEPTDEGRKAQLALIDYLLAQKFAQASLEAKQIPQETPEHVATNAGGKVLERVIREKTVYALRPDMVQLLQASVRETSVRTLEKFCMGDPELFPDTKEMVELGKKLRRSVPSMR